MYLGPQSEPGYNPGIEIVPSDELPPNFPLPPADDPIAALLPEDREWLASHGWVPAPRKLDLDEFYDPRLISTDDDGSAFFVALGCIVGAALIVFVLWPLLVGLFV